MIRMGKGQAECLEQSLEEAVQSVKAPQFLLFFSKFGTLEEAAAFLAARFPNIPSIGFCSISVVHDDLVDNPDILILSFEEEYRIACGLIKDLDECPVQHIYQFQKDVESLNAGDEDTVCFECCTGNEEMLVTTLNAVLDKHHIPLIGTSVYEGTERIGKTQVAFCGEICKDACAYALIRCRNGKVRTYYENIYMRTELTFHQVTKADPDSRSIIEIDGRPAADVYSDIVQVPRNEIISISQRYPLGRVIGSRVFVAGISNVLEDGTLVCYKRINPNDAICFMDYGRYREVASETIERIRKENDDIYFTLTGECIFRYWLYKNENFQENHAQNMSLLGSHAGMYCGGEQYHYQHINQGMVIAVFSHDQERRNSNG